MSDIPFAMHIQPFQALYPDQQMVASEIAFFDTTKENYSHFLQHNFFYKMNSPAIFLYQIQSLRRIYTGVLASTDLKDYTQGNIKKHEHTIRTEEEKQMRLTLERRAAVKPVLLTYAENELIDQWIEQYISTHSTFLEINFSEEEQIHRIWAVQEQTEILQIQQLFRDQVAHAYIADGHHRMSAMELICETNENEALRQAYSEVYCAFFPSGQLDILEFNRVVQLPENLSIENLLQSFESLFIIEPLTASTKPSQLHEMTLCTSQGWYRLCWKHSILLEYTDMPVVLDTMLLNEQVIDKLLHISDVRYDQRIEYVDAAKGLNAIQQKIIKNPNLIGFCLYPVQFNDLKNLVEAGGTMPPKSTWFEPRMKNGLIVKIYE
ncbi:MAG: DUF1015 domain-containing protein [Saprospiraceae bacterium]|nr:DUF1015 domain-containing protein [Saprospiraceae bacterium]